MVVTGRATLYQINSYGAGWDTFANVVSGLQETVSRSSVVAMDDWLRENIFGYAITVKKRNKQVIMWTADICGSQFSELSTLVVVGLLAKVFQRHSETFDFGDIAADDTALMRGIFTAFLIEVGVDLFSAYIERRQGIRTELWVHDLSASMMAALGSMNFAMVLLYLYLIRV